MGNDALQPGNRLGFGNQTWTNESFSLKTNLRRWWGLFIRLLPHKRGSGVAWWGNWASLGAEPRLPIPEPCQTLG